MTNKEVLILTIQSMLNKPYKWGGYNPIDGYDCSGLTQDLLAPFGLDPSGDQTSNMLMEKFSKSGKKIDLPEFGAVLFFGKDQDKATHVSIALNGLSMIEAGGGGSRTNTIDDAKKQNAFVRIRNINRRRDIINIIRLNINWGATY